MAEIDRTDFEFLNFMSHTLSNGADMARSYLAHSDPETRRANVADLARNTIEVHTQLLGDIQGWLEEATPPSSDHDEVRVV